MISSLICMGGHRCARLFSPFYLYSKIRLTPQRSWSSSRTETPQMEIHCPQLRHFAILAELSSLAYLQTQLSKILVDSGESMKLIRAGPARHETCLRWLVPHQTIQGLSRHFDAVVGPSLPLANASSSFKPIIP